MSRHPALDYFRDDSPGVPHLWCPGCGIGQIWYATIRAIKKLNLDTDKVLWVGGSGCSGRMCTYWYKDFLHTLHGRAIGFATGAKLANPALNVFVHSGDGECMAIGGNHLIHAARRNVDLNVLCVNNFNYGMTGGQFSPTTPPGAVTVTSPYGNIERTFDLVELMKTCGATYVARWTTAHLPQVSNAIVKAVGNKGFSFVEIIAQCPSQFGKSSRVGSAIDLIRWFKQQSISLSQAKTMSETELQHKFVVGEFVNRTEPEYASGLHQLCRRSNGE